MKTGKLLKKNNIAVDVVLLGEHEANGPKLRAFVDAAQSNDTSNLVSIPALSLIHISEPTRPY